MPKASFTFCVMHKSITQERTCPPSPLRGGHRPLLHSGLNPNIRGDFVTALEGEGWGEGAAVLMKLIN